jgi:hypothetical protein
LIVTRNKGRKNAARRAARSAETSYTRALRHLNGTEPATLENRTHVAPALASPAVPDKSSHGTVNQASPRLVWHYPQLFAQTSLPYRDPGDDTASWTRRNGDLVLRVAAGASDPVHPATPTGLPFGWLPRLLLAFIATELVEHGDPYIEFPSTPAKFMMRLGIPEVRMDRIFGQLRDHAVRLFSASFMARWGGSSRDISRGFVVAESWDLDWDSDAGTVPFIRCTREFVEQVVNGPVALDVNAFLALNKSPFGMDIYAWLCHRLSYLTKPTVVPLDFLNAQFGFQYEQDDQGLSEFTSRLIETLCHVLTVYPEADVGFSDQGLILKPSPAHVPRRPPGTDHHSANTVRTGLPSNSTRETSTTTTWEQLQADLGPSSDAAHFRSAFDRSQDELTDLYTAYRRRSMALPEWLANPDLPIPPHSDATET